MCIRIHICVVCLFVAYLLIWFVLFQTTAAMDSNNESTESVDEMKVL